MLVWRTHLPASYTSNQANMNKRAWLTVIGALKLHDWTHALAHIHYSSCVPSTLAPIPQIRKDSLSESSDTLPQALETQSITCCRPGCFKLLLAARARDSCVRNHSTHSSISLHLNGRFTRTSMGCTRPVQPRWNQHCLAVAFTACCLFGLVTDVGTIVISQGKSLVLTGSTMHSDTVFPRL